MRKKPKSQPESDTPETAIVAALRNLGSRIERLEARTVESATRVLSPLAEVGVSNKPSTPPPNLIDSMSDRIGSILHRVRRASAVIVELGASADGPVPQDAEGHPAYQGDRPPLAISISVLDQEVEMLLDRLGRLHPNAHG